MHQHGIWALAVVLEVLAVVLVQPLVAWAGAWEALALVLVSELVLHILTSLVQYWHANLHPGIFHRWLHHACGKPGLLGMVNSEQRQAPHQRLQPIQSQYWYR